MKLIFGQMKQFFDYVNKKNFSFTRGLCKLREWQAKGIALRRSENGFFRYGTFSHPIRKGTRLTVRSATPDPPHFTQPKHKRYKCSLD
jgi:hypothetical protein